MNAAEASSFHEISLEIESPQGWVGGNWLKELSTDAFNLVRG